MKYLNPLLLTFCFFFILFSSTHAQDEIAEAEVTPNEMVIRSFDFPATEEKIRAFHPFDFPGQLKNLGKDTDVLPGRMNNWIIGSLVALALVVLFIFLLIRVKGIFPRILIGLSGFILLILVGYFFLILDAYAKMAPPAAMGKAIERLTNLSKSLAVEWLDLRHPKDDDYRLGMVRSRIGVIIVDYKSNQGWYIPKGQVSEIVAHPDSTFKKDAQAIELFTEDSRTTPLLQRMVFVLKGNNPSQIWIQHGDDFYQYDPVASIEDFILAWEEQVN